MRLPKRLACESARSVHSIASCAAQVTLSPKVETLVGGGLEHDMASQASQPLPIGVAESLYEVVELACPPRRESLGEWGARGGERDSNGATVVWAGSPADEASSFGSVDEASDAGFLQVENPGQLEH